MNFDSELPKKIIPPQGANQAVNIDNKTEKEKTEEEKENENAAVKFNEQAFLMLNWENYVQNSKNTPYVNFACIEHDEPAELQNILFKKAPKFDILLNTNSAQMSYFVPRIRIFKEYPNEKGQVRKTVELPLSQGYRDRKSTRLNSSHVSESRMPSSA